MRNPNKTKLKVVPIERHYDKDEMIGILGKCRRFVKDDKVRDLVILVRCKSGKTVATGSMPWDDRIVAMSQHVQEMLKV